MCGLIYVDKHAADAHLRRAQPRGHRILTKILSSRLFKQFRHSILNIANVAAHVAAHVFKDSTVRYV